MTDLDTWLAIPATDRRKLAHEAWCRVGTGQGYCSVCHLAFRGLAPFELGFRKGVEGCRHPDLVRNGSLTLSERREVRGVVTLRASLPGGREHFALSASEDT